MVSPLNPEYKSHSVSMKLNSSSSSCLGFNYGVHSLGTMGKRGQGNTRSDPRLLHATVQAVSRRVQASQVSQAIGVAGASRAFLLVLSGVSRRLWVYGPEHPCPRPVGKAGLVGAYADFLQVLSGVGRRLWAFFL
jgi:hypothetical protein